MRMAQSMKDSLKTTNFKDKVFLNQLFEYDINIFIGRLASKLPVKNAAFLI